MKKVIIIHTSLVSMDLLQELFAKLCPNTQVNNIVDDSLLAEAMLANEVTTSMQRRMDAYVTQAASMNPDLIFNQCSSLGEAFENAAESVSCPTLRVDSPMAEEAAFLCRDGGKIAVVATVASTCGPSVRLLENKVRKTGKSVEIKPILLDGALSILMKEKNKEKHDAIIISAVKEASGWADVIVLAQGSMYQIGNKIRESDMMQKPVLASPYLGVSRASEILG